MAGGCACAAAPGAVTMQPMDTFTASPCFDLAPGTALRLEAAAGRELLVHSGRVWLTCTGGGEDLFLVAGQRLRLGAGAVVECDSPGAARLQLAPPRWRQAVGTVLAGLAALRPRRTVPRQRRAG